MEPIVFAETEGEVYDTGAVRLRFLAQSPDQPIAVTDITAPPDSRVRSGTGTPA